MNKSLILTALMALFAVKTYASVPPDGSVTISNNNPVSVDITFCGTSTNPHVPPVCSNMIIQPGTQNIVSSQILGICANPPVNITYFFPGCGPIVHGTFNCVSGQYSFTGSNANYCAQPNPNPLTNAYPIFNQPSA